MRFHSSTRLGALVSPIPPDQIRKLLEIGRKSDEELHPDFPATGELSGAHALKCANEHGLESRPIAPALQGGNKRPAPQPSLVTLPQVLRELERRAR